MSCAAQQRDCCLQKPPVVFWTRSHNPQTIAEAFGACEYRIVLMPTFTRDDFQTRLNALDRDGHERASRLVEAILSEAARRSASDVHFEPTHRSLEVRYRTDGVLQHVATLRRELAGNVVARLKVLADLLTYRLDIPQEGRLREALGQFGVDMRVSTFPTIHGEKAAVRLFDASGRTLDLEQLGLQDDVLHDLTVQLRERSGAILLTGPSGSGKTTTIYACLRHLVRAGSGGRHIVTIEDPVEQVIEGVSQAQARPGTEFDFARGLRSLLRQDPEIIMIGEVRDAETAAIAIEAALTGHLVFSTLHAGSACGVVSRLLDMGIENYLLTSGIKGILNQRLVRRLCSACRRPAEAQADTVVCDVCAGTGYQGRLLLAELLTLDDPLRKAILAKADTVTLEAATRPADRATIWTAADRAVANGLTTKQEIERVLGPR
jgi:type II secretory ATPase GspE/PulE/Tfp pilus assembly ATPase PilB-like protein